MNVPKSAKLHFLVRPLVGVVTIAAFIVCVSTAGFAISEIIMEMLGTSGYKTSNWLLPTICLTVFSFVSGWIFVFFNRMLKADTAARIPLTLENSPFVCQCCGKEVPTIATSLNKHVGMIILMQHTSMNGRFCKACISKTALNFSVMTFFLGWWGFISFFITPLVLLRNTISFIQSRRLSSEPYTVPATGAAEVNQAELLKLKDTIDLSLKQGASIEALSNEIAKTVGITPPQAYRCICEFAAAQPA